MRLIYVPIADSFFESSIMREELTVRFVMLALIRLALRPGSGGVVDIDQRVFASSINIPLEDVERAIKRLMEPDPHSGCPDEEGRRVVPVDPARPFRGWRLVNWAKYVEVVHRANDAARKREERAAKKYDPDASENVHERPETSDLSENGATKTNTNTNTNTKTIRKEKRGGERASRFTPPTLEDVQAFAAELQGLQAERFFNYFESKGWKVGSQPMKDWHAAARNWRLKDLEDGKAGGNGSRPPQRPPGPSQRPPGFSCAPDGSWLMYRNERFDRMPRFEHRGIAGWYYTSGDNFGNGSGFRLDGTGKETPARWSPAEFVDFFRANNVPGLPEDLVAAQYRELSARVSAPDIQTKESE